MHRFYMGSQLNSPKSKIGIGDTVELPSIEIRHAFRVLRLREGHSVEVTDGEGGLWQARISSASKDRLLVVIENELAPEPKSKVELCFAIPKPPALEFILRRGTELGISGFHPIFSVHSEGLSGFNEARWARVFAECCKQSQQAFFPKWNPPKMLVDALQSLSVHTQVIVCDETKRAAAPLPSQSARSVSVWIGPEGGWHDLERRSFQEMGAQYLSLGPLRLRAELAAVVALVRAKERLQEFG